MLRALFLFVAVVAAVPVRAQFERLPKDATLVFVAGDLLPPVQQLLKVPEVRRLLEAVAETESGPMGELLQPRRLERQLQAVADLIPEKLVLGCPTATTDSLWYTLQAMCCAVLLMPAQNANDAQLVEPLRALAGDGLASVKGFDGVLVATMRNERAAETLFERLVGLLEMVKGVDGVEVSESGDDVRVVLDLLAVGDGQLMQWFEQTGVELPDGLALQLTATLSQVGDELRLRLGEPAAGPLPRAALGELWSDQNAPLLYGQRTSTVGKSVETLEGLVAEAALADDGMLSMIGAQLYQSLGNMTRLVTPGSSALWLDDGVRIDYRTPLPADAEQPSPATAALVDCLDPTDGPCWLVDDSLDALLSMLFDAAELIVDGRGGGAYDALPAVAEFVGGEDSVLFEDGIAFVTRPGAFRSLSFGAGTEPELGAMPWGVFAVVAPAFDERAARAFMAGLQDGLSDDLGLDAAPWQAQDLGLGVDAFAVDLKLLAPELENVELDCDFAPHWFVVGRHLVWSTDVALSRDLVARLQGAAASDVQVAPTARLFVDGAAMVSCLRGARTWVDTVAGDANPMAAAAEAIDATLELLGRVRSVEVLGDRSGGVERTRLHLRILPR